MVAILVLLVGTSAGEPKLVVLSGHDLARINGGEATAGCYFQSTAGCDAAPGRCGETICDGSGTDAVCPASAVDEEQYTAAYNIAVGSPDSGQVSKKKLDPINCVKQYACKSAGKKNCLMNTSTGSYYCPSMRQPGPPSAFRGPQVPEVPDGKKCPDNPLDP
jgi:hypothetical protein